MTDAPLVNSVPAPRPAPAPAWRDRKVIVTGGTGFVGSHLVERLVEAGAEVTVTGRREAAAWHPVASVRTTARYLQGDLADEDFARRACAGQECLFHLAAVVGGIGFNIAHPAMLFTRNVVPGLRAFDAAHGAGVRRLVCVSSACVYPRGARVPTPEEDGFQDEPEAGNWGYGWGKRALEVHARLCEKEYGLSVAIVRPFNVYGPRDNFDPATSHVIPALFRKAAAPGDVLEVWGDGSPTRTFVYVEDTVDGLILAAERAEDSAPINLGSDEEVTIARLVEAVLRATGARKRIVFDPEKPGGQPRRACDTRRARERLGFSPRVDLATGLRRTWEWLQLPGNASLLHD